MVDSDYIVIRVLDQLQKLGAGVLRRGGAAELAVAVDAQHLRQSRNDATAVRKQCSPLRWA